MIVHSHFSFTRFAALALAAAGLCAAQAAAQVAYTEPPDLSGSLTIPTPVGTLSSGLNTITGTLATTWNIDGNSLGDAADSLSFIVPVGLAVTSIEVDISNFVCNGCASRVRSFSAGIGAVVISNGNGTYTVPIAGPLGAGTYGLQVDSRQGSANMPGTGVCTYQFRITAIPTTNDSCLFPTTIGLGATPFNTTTATTDGPAAAGCASGPNQDLWYQFVPAATGLVTVSTCGASFDSVLAVYSGDCGTLALVACNDDNPVCGGFFNVDSQLAFIAAAGTPYRIRVGGYLAAIGTGTLGLSIATTGACCNRSTGGCLTLSAADCQTFGGTFVGFAVACSPANCVACPADFNGGGISASDIFDFLNAWFAGCP